MLSRAMADAIQRRTDMQVVTQDLSITTFRFVPPDLRASLGDEPTDRYLDGLNRALLDAVQRGGEAFVSNAVVHGRYVLRACIVNFNTERSDVEALPDIVARQGRRLDVEMRPLALRRSNAGSL